MAEIGYTKKLYLKASGSNYTMLAGETSSSINLSADMIEVSDKETSWKKYVAGYKGGTVDATVYADSNDNAQIKLIGALLQGTEVECFIGKTSSANTPNDGFVFKALVTSIGETYDTASAIARNISLQITGEVSQMSFGGGITPTAE